MISLLSTGVDDKTDELALELFSSALYNIIIIVANNVTLLQ